MLELLFRGLVEFLTTAFIVKKYLNKKEGVEYNPYLYGLYTLLFGYLFSVFMYYGKLNKERYGENNKSSFIFYFIAYIIVAINIVYIFTCIN